MTLELPVIARVAAALVVALLISFISTPVVKSIAQRVGAMDIPKDNRRMHHHPIPRMGGLAIFLGFLLSALIFVPMDQANRGMLLGAVVIVILGIFDDIYALPALPKLLVQIGAALIAASSRRAGFPVMGPAPPPGQQAPAGRPPRNRPPPGPGRSPGRCRTPPQRPPAPARSTAG